VVTAARTGAPASADRTRPKAADRRRPAHARAGTPAQHTRDPEEPPMPTHPDRRSLLRAAAVSTVPAGALAAALALPGDALADPRSAGHHRPSVAEVRRWTTAYLEAWRLKDAEAAGRLFTEDALYEAVPGVADQTYRGREAIEAYWADVTAPQSEMSYRFGTPMVGGRRAVVELWVTMRVPGANPGGDDWVTLIETNILSFARPRLCRRNVEYWNLQPGRLDPPAGWGEDR
jgi:uncharacterized protein (TIGR02246 family)